MQFSGERTGTGPCTAGYTANLTESSRAVAVSIVTHNHPGSGVCPADAFLDQLTVVLPSALGARVLVDGGTGQPYSVTASSARP